MLSENTVKKAGLFVDTHKKYNPLLGMVALNGRVMATDLDCEFQRLETGPEGCYTVPTLELWGLTGAIKRDACFEDYPTALNMTDGQFIGDFSAEVIATGFKTVLKSASNDQTRYNINGICLDPEYGLVATDGHRLITYKNGFERRVEKQVILPSSGVKKVIKWIGCFDAIQQKQPIEVYVSFETNMIRFKSDIEQVTMRLVDGQYPQFPQVIPASLKYKSDLLAGMKLKEAVKKLRGINKASGDKNAAIKITEHVIEYKKQSVFLINGPIESVGISARYLADAIEQTGSGVIGSNSPVEPIVFNGNPDVMVVIMPMKFE